MMGVIFIKLANMVHSQITFFLETKGNHQSSCLSLSLKIITKCVHLAWISRAEGTALNNSDNHTGGFGIHGKTHWLCWKNTKSVI